MPKSEYSERLLDAWKNDKVGSTEAPSTRAFEASSVGSSPTHTAKQHPAQANLVEALR